MWLLALETTTREGSVALLRDDTVVAERAGAPDLSHAERLPADIAAVLAEAGLTASNIDLFAVASGPGGFTGLRIGLAAIQGLAVALDRPAAGVPTLPALAWAALDADPALDAAGAWLDASRGEVFAGAWSRPPAGADAWPLPALVTASAAAAGEILARWATAVDARVMPVVAACGPAAIAALHGAGYRTLPPPARLAATIGRIGWRMHALGLSGPPHALEPEYVKRADVEIDRDRRLAAAPPR